MKSSDNAVSPVIGVIVMIAITVILATTIFFVVMGWANDAGHAKIVSANAQQIGDTQIVITYMGGKDTADCIKISATVTSQSGQIQNQELSPQAGSVMPGSRLSFAGDYTRNDHVTVKAWFKDGSNTVIYDSSL
jgi:archaeal type IV pilus assembly protein PilA